MNRRPVDVHGLPNALSTLSTTISPSPSTGPGQAPAETRPPDCPHRPTGAQESTESGTRADALPAVTPGAACPWAPRRSVRAGSASDWITDLGGIRTARATEAAILFVPHVIRSTGFTPFAISIVR